METENDYLGNSTLCPCNESGDLHVWRYLKSSVNEDLKTIHYFYCIHCLTIITKREVT